MSDLALHRLGQRPPPEVEDLHKLIDRGQGAINELRRVLPHYIAYLHKKVERGPNALLFLAGNSPVLEREWRVRQIQEIETYNHMLCSLINFEPDKPEYKRRAIWRDLLSWEAHAVEIFDLFGQFMGRASTTKNGPAVRFVCSVLARAGVHTDAGAIEQMLRRNKNVSAKKKVDADALEKALAVRTQAPKDYK